MNFGSMIKERRRELGLTLEQVGDRCGVGKSTVRKWESGMIRNVRRDKIALLASVLQIDPVDLIDCEMVGDTQPSIVLTPDELALVTAYRAADDRARDDAMHILSTHQKGGTP